MGKGKVISVVCQCGLFLARYFKAGPGRLQKMYLSRVREDCTGIFSKKKYELFEALHCPECNKRIATIIRMRGKIAAKVNHGAIEYRRT